MNDSSNKRKHTSINTDALENQQQTDLQPIEVPHKKKIRLRFRRKKPENEISTRVDQHKESAGLDINNLLEDMRNESDINIITASKKNNNAIKVNSIPTSSYSGSNVEIKLKPWETAFEDILNQMKSNRQSKNTFLSSPINGNNINIINQEKIINIWWFDAYEKIDKGQVYLFGKIYNNSSNQYESCCIIIKNIMQTLFVLPRQYKLIEKDGSSQMEPVLMDDVINEFTETLQRYKIQHWKSSIVKRKYAFELKDIPKESTYLKIQYSFEDPKLPQGISGHTYSHVFGTNINPMEHFLIKRHIMGPSWLSINNPIKNNAKETWCRHEFIIMDPKNINPITNNKNQSLETPSLTIMTLQLHTLLNTEKNVNEILAAGAIVCPQVYIDQDNGFEKQNSLNFVVIRKWDHQKTLPKDLEQCINKENEKGLDIIIQHTEYALLSYLCGKIHLYDPDIIVGHDFSSYTLDILLHRMKELDIPFWHKLGRLRWKSFPKLQSGPGGTDLSTSKEKMILVGRLLCDTYTASKDLIQSKSYHLTTLAKTQLGIERQDVTFEKNIHLFNDASCIINMIKHCWMDAYFSTAILFKIQILPLTKMLTNISGNLWSRSLNGARSNRNEYLLLHEFHRLKYICPDNLSFEYQDIELFGLEEDPSKNDQVLMKSLPNSSTNVKKKRVYDGGLVLEPRSGFYDKCVILLDFNSLYPSIIQEFNICFTTVDRHVNNNESDTEILPSYPDANIPQGVLPRLVKRFVDERKQVKDQMKNQNLEPSKKLQYDIKQRALKLTANSIYGCLGFSQSRFAARQLAMMITAKGRSILQDSVHVAEDLGLEVIYGDTDSIMIATGQTDLEKVRDIGILLQEKVNVRYNLLELEIDGIFRRMLILTKKKYAALTVENKNNIWIESIESKGLDLVRKDWCEVSREVSMEILKIILSDLEDKNTIILNTLKDTCDNIRNRKISPSKFIIYKQLTKNLDEYSNADSFPHVRVAKKLRELGKIIKQGDTVEYIICITENEEHASIAEKACYPDQVENGEFSIDNNWYIKHQILPPIIRLCERIMDTAHFEESIGINKQMKKGRHQKDSYLAKTTTATKEKRRNRNSNLITTTVTIEELYIRCQHCETKSIFPGYTRCMNDDDQCICSLQCPACLQMMGTASILAQLTLHIRNCINKYYQGWLHCEEIDCTYRTNDISTRCKNTVECNGLLKREYTENMLYQQLIYFRNLFDPKTNTPTNNESSKQAIADQYHHAFKILYEAVQKYIDQCEYRYIYLNNLFNNVEE
ncbi:hypothetical protein BJ944DRAFT_101122 [Cunninghamella echinulata]|nr:hypothetical protein BJ944DRAFT_101122 [Cunninghamella echinulata]